jgi:hypothetical protein
MLDTKEIEFYDAYHLPIIKAYADKIDLVNTINRLVPTKIEMDPGTLSLVMVMGAELRTLYRLKEEFRSIFEKIRDRQNAARFLSAWTLRASMTGNKYLAKFVTTLRNWWEAVHQGKRQHP